jgi:hypothetical protein
MKTIRQKPETRWRNIGAHAARRGYAVTSVLTADKSCNELIREGYEAEKARMKREKKQPTPS